MHHHVKRILGVYPPIQSKVLEVGICGNRADCSAERGGIFVEGNIKVAAFRHHLQMEIIDTSEPFRGLKDDAIVAVSRPGMGYNPVF